MSDESDDDKTADRVASVTPRLDEERPLNSLMPEMNERQARRRVGGQGELEKTPLHPRVLEVELDDGMEWALAAWEDPGQLELVEHVQRLIAGTLLSEMSQPPSRDDLLDREFRAVELLVFDELFGETRFGLEKLGFEEVDYRADHYAERMDAWREEAEAIGHDVPAQPRSVWRSELSTPDQTLDSKLDRVHRQLARSLRDEVWGEVPGAPSKALAEKMRQHFNTSVTPTPDGLDSLELFLVQEGGEYLRWMRPLLFQGLCDFVGVVLQAHYGCQVDWAVCDVDERGFAQPPLFRLRRGGRTETFPVGPHMVRWALMPELGDDIGTIRARLEAVVDAL